MVQILKRNGLGMHGRRVVDAFEWKVTLTKIQGKVFLNKIRVLQSKFIFKSLLETFKHTSQVIEMSTLSLMAQTRSNDYVSIRHKYPR
jgi:hypothetical protein